MIVGKSTKSYRKKTQADDKSLAIGFKVTRFAHAPQAGDTSFSIFALTTPAQLSARGFVQPTSSELEGMGLQFYRKNLTLMSTARGVMWDYLDYTVSSTGLIKFTDDFGPALENELFLGIIDPVVRTGTLVADTNFILRTGVLSAGETDFNVGKAFKVNENPGEQIGAVMVFAKGQKLWRNVGNATASPSADGNYEEVDNGAGESTLIRFNEASDEDREIAVMSTTLSVIRPDGSINDVLEKVQGTIDKIVEVLAVVSGLDESAFFATPTYPQLKQFGDRLIAAEQDIDSAEGRLDDLEDPTQMSDALATRLGYKQYESSGAYNGGAAPTITSSTIAGALTVVRGIFIPYQMQGGGWRLRANLVVSFPSESVQDEQVTINGVVFKNSGNSQPISGHLNNDTAVRVAVAIQNTGNLRLIMNGTANGTEFRASFDVELESKPTWAY